MTNRIIITWIQQMSRLKKQQSKSTTTSLFTYRTAIVRAGRLSDGCIAMGIIPVRTIHLLQARKCYLLGCRSFDLAIWYICLFVCCCATYYCLCLCLWFVVGRWVSLFLNLKFVVFNYSSAQIRAQDFYWNYHRKKRGGRRERLK